MGPEPVSDPAPTLVTRLDGPAPEAQVAKDMVRRSLPLIPLLLLADAIGWGIPGVCAGAYAIAIVLANLGLSALLLAWAARISLALVMAAAMFGFLIRLGLIFLAVMLVKDASWINLWALGMTLIVTHLGLLFWEMRYVSLSLAHPGLKPESRKTPASLAATRR
jgi:hypothetical protein